MLRLLGPIQTVVATVEPSIGYMAVNKNMHNNNICHQQSNLILTYSQYTNLAIFMILFMLCAVEVIFVKIVTAINVDDVVVDGNYPLDDDDDDDVRNNNSLHQIDRELAHQTAQQQRQRRQHQRPETHLITTQTFLQRITQATAMPFDNNNNNTNHNYYNGN